MVAAKHVLSSLKRSPSLAIEYEKKQFKLTGYTDASSAVNPDNNRRSTTGYMLMLSGAPVSFGEVTQTLTVHFTVEAELIAAAHG